MEEQKFGAYQGSNNNIRCIPFGNTGRNVGDDKPKMAHGSPNLVGGMLWPYLVKVKWVLSYNRIFSIWSDRRLFYILPLFVFSSKQSRALGIYRLHLWLHLFTVHGTPVSLYLWMLPLHKSLRFMYVIVVRLLICLLCFSLTQLHATLQKFHFGMSTRVALTSHVFFSVW